MVKTILCHHYKPEYSGIDKKTSILESVSTILDFVTHGIINNSVINAGNYLMTLRSNATQTARITDLNNAASNDNVLLKS